ncbi:MAG: hypothetical protein IPK58_05500 [Acidobacteria bacterium]|nr:hypothetical protein [Acidobacteriota bacterium]
MNIVIVIIQVCGIAFIIGFVLALLNWGFGLHLGIKGAEVPGDPVAGLFFLVLGIVFTILGKFLDKKFGS